jgi:hypothetical protein
MKLGMGEIMQRASDIIKKDEKIAYLRDNDNVALRMMLKMAFDKNLKWALPDGDAPYKPSDLTDNQGALYNEARKIYLFHEGGHPNLTQSRREFLFIQLLESIDPADAKFLLAVKNKKLPWKTVTKKLIDEAYPGLLVY